MTDDPKDTKDLPDSDIELEEELARWDETFDALHDPEVPRAEDLRRALGPEEEEVTGTGNKDPFGVAQRDGLAPSGLLVDAPDPFLEVDDSALDKMFDFEGEPQALGDLLGPPPPLQPPEEEAPSRVGQRRGPGGGAAGGEEDVYTSAARPTLAPAPTDEELFGDLPDELPDELEAASLGTLRTDGAGIEPTRIADVDAELLAESAKEEPARGPAIVRREDLERMRRARAQAEARAEFVSQQATRIADSEVIDGIVEAEAEAAKAAAEAFFSEEQAEVRLELDEDFYDNIEIGASEEEEEEAPPKPSFAARSTGRRTSAHIVRRSTSAAKIPIPPPPETEAEQEGAVVLELEAEPSDATVRPPAIAVGELGAPPAEAARGELLIDREATMPPGEEGVGLAEPELVGAAAAEGPVVLGVAPPAEEEPALEDIELPVEEEALLEEVELPVEEEVLLEEVELPAEEEALLEEVELPEPAPIAGLVAEPEPEPMAEPEAVAEPEPEPARAPAVAVAARSAADVLAEVDVMPEVPASSFPGAVEPSENLLHLEALDLPEQVEPLAEDRSEERARQLLLYERELELLDDAVPMARLRLEAGRLAERLGDLEHARAHYDEALVADPRLVSALRALRRVQRATGDWEGAISSLDTEIQHTSPAERRALAAHRADLLMAVGEQDLARVAVGELLDESPDDVRALLANMQLAYIDGRDDELESSLSRLAAALEDRDLSACMHEIRGRLGERVGDDDAARTAFQAACEVQPGVRTALLGLLRVALRADAPQEATRIQQRIAEETDLAERDAAYAAALEWRRALSAAKSDDEEAEWDALNRAAGIASQDAIALEGLASACERRGEFEAAVRVLLRLAEVAPSEAESAACYVRAAAHLAGPVGAPADAAEALRRAVQIDPCDAGSAADIEGALAADGDTEALIAIDRRAVEADPKAAVFERMRLAARLAAEARIEEAINALQLGSDEELPEGAYVIADALSSLLGVSGRASERVALLAAFAEREPEQVHPWVAYRRAAKAAEELAFAWLAEEAAGPEALDAGHAQARLEERRQIIRSAIASWQKVIDLDPDSPSAHAACVRLAAAAEDRELSDRVLAAAQASERHAAAAVGLALRRFAALWGIRPEHEPGASALAAAAPATAAERERAEEVLREALAIAPADARLAQALFIAAASGGRWDDAARSLEERVAAIGDADEANQLRYRAAAILLDRADEPSRAVDLLAQLVEKVPQFAAGTELLQAAHRRLGDATALAENLDRAVTAPDLGGARGDSFALLVREAELYHYRVGDPSKAVHLYGEALKLRPADPLARDGLTRAAAAAGEAAPVAELALQDLKHAEEAGDVRAKADAYEELARIDATIRGDRGSALLGWESAVAADPTRHTLLRVLESSYLRDGRTQDLLELYGKQLAAIGEGPDVVTLALTRARLAEILDRPWDEVLHDYALAYKNDRSSRTALFRLESSIRREGPLDQLPTLEVAVADYFAGEPRARAAFLTRAGESLADLNEVEAAIRHFRAAQQLLPGYFPALAGWRHAAVKAEMWLDAAEAAQREAECALSDTARVRLNHMAGVILMDRALNGERAVFALRKVLAIDPGHSDAFVRLRVLFDEQGEHEDLAQLLHNRLEFEKDKRARLELLQSLADLHRNFLDDREEARKYLRGVLEIAPRNLPAIAALADIAWEQGEWAEAAETLIARARLETDETTLKGIFYRLGTIYSDRLPDARWALKSFQKVLSYDPNDQDALAHIAELSIRTGEWKNALAACERLIKLAEDKTDKVVHLHRAAQIYLEGFQDRTRAERALRVALDLDPAGDEALARLVAFYAEANDHRSLHVHMDRVAATMRKRLLKNPADGVAYRMIARAMEAREKAGVKGSLATARCAAELAQMCGSSDDIEDRLAAHASQVKPRISGLGKNTVDDLLYPPEVPPELRGIFERLGERIAKHVGIDLRRYGVGRGERLPKNDPMVQMILEVGEQMGVENVDVYLSKKYPKVMVVEPTNPISLVVGEDIASAEEPAAVRFVAGRGLKLALASLAVPPRLSPDDFGVLLVALLRQFQPEFTSKGIDADKLAQEQQRLRRLIPSGMMQELRPFAMATASATFDHKRIWAGIVESGDRAGLLASGSVAAALQVVCKARGYKDLAAAARDLTVMDLMRFAVSQDHSALRAALGG